MGGWGSVDMLRRYQGKLSYVRAHALPDDPFEVRAAIGQWCSDDNGVGAVRRAGRVIFPRRAWTAERGVVPRGASVTSSSGVIRA